jgi:thiamine-monophosphate kinase
VTGHLGDAGLALLHLQGELTLPKAHRDAVLRRLNQPMPRIEAGLALLDYASAAIDISDGLAADLGHILEMSGVGARVDAFRVPISDALRSCFALAGGWALPLSAGDDYELCFTVAEKFQAVVEQKMAELGIPCTWIGFIESKEGLRCLSEEGFDITPSRGGFQHF